MLNSTAMVCDDFRIWLRALWLGAKFIRSITSKTRLRVSSLMPGRLFMTSETVEGETPASFAISTMVSFGMIPLYLEEIVYRFILMDKMFFVKRILRDKGLD
ncbi:hypothetical protein SDC9_152394 [bioreactor metagenome]|uniref:Uncharacterized protein n=1 Tax=bioreactor metagenome TaxID=1076179 RepID=A0A645EXI1_9ZZZZ